MDIEAVFESVKDALADISTYDKINLVAKHPDIWTQQSATFPILSLIFSAGDFDHESGDQMWSKEHKTRIELEAHLIITSSDDSLSDEFLRQFVAIQDAIKALTITAAFRAHGRIYISNVQTAQAENGNWMWGVMTLVVGE